MIKVTSATSSVSSFTWSTSEQVYPFEKDASGRTLYCKYYNLGAMPNSGWKFVAHGITAWAANKVHSIKIYAQSANDQGNPSTILISSTDGSHLNQMQVYADNINVFCNSNYYSANGYSAYIQLIYAK